MVVAIELYKFGYIAVSCNCTCCVHWFHMRQKDNTVFCCCLHSRKFSVDLGFSITIQIRIHHHFSSFFFWVL